MWNNLTIREIKRIIYVCKPAPNESKKRMKKWCREPKTDMFLTLGWCEQNSFPLGTQILGEN